MRVPFNKPFFSGGEAYNMAMAAFSGQISGNGVFTKKCHDFFRNKFGFKKVLLTTSCSDALEMAAILSEIGAGDEVIMPSFTFMSTANAFILRGAKVVFADTYADIPNIDPGEIEKLITPRTRVIVLVHYSGIACDMDRIMRIAEKRNLIVVEDAAHAIDSFYKGRPLGSIGHFGTFSFHETKNIISGEGGMLTVNDDRFISRAEIIWEKGTNRAAFHRGEVDKYGWVDVGSSFLPAEMIAAFLYAQLEVFDFIQKKRKQAWIKYFNLLKPLQDRGLISLPHIPDYASMNGNLFYFFTRSLSERTNMLDYLKSKGVHAVFHYLPLEQSVYFKDKHDGRLLPNTQRFSDCIVRLPFFVELKQREIDYVCKAVISFYNR